MPIYEAKEWTRLWYDEAPDDKTPRAMLISDSITAGYTPAVNKHLAGELRADSIAGSKGLDHPFYNEEIDLFAREFGFAYRLIHFNNGLHALHMDAETYGRLYEEKVIWLKERFPAARLALVTSTAINAPGAEKVLHPEKNAIVIARNEKVWDIARKYDLPVDDLYAAMLDQPGWRAEDGYHFNAEGVEEQGRLVSTFIREQIAK